MWLYIAGQIISTLLLMWVNRRMRSKFDNSIEQQPSKYSDSNVNSIGSSIPVALGRVMIKNPLVSYYGDFDYRPYTEEYGAHANLDIGTMLILLLINIIAIITTPDTVVTNTGGGQTVDSGTKRALIVNAVVQFLIWLLMELLFKHELKTTIQKGFMYYLGWQNILCWTGNNIGIKRLWMNVYDTNVEKSTQQGVWGSDNINE